MQIAASFRRVCCPLLFFTVLLALSITCDAVPMKVTLGFGGVQKSGVWTPVAVSLKNAGDENIEGTLVLSVPDLTDGPLPTCTTQVSLPGHSTKLYHTYVRLAPFCPKLNVALLPKGFGVLASKDVNTQIVDLNDMLIVTIGNRASRLSFLQNENINVPRRPAPSSYGGPAPGTSPGQVTIHAGSLLPTELPDRPAAYEGASVIVASGLSPDTVNPNALKALCMWVAGGGTLVVSAGADYKACMNPFYDELLPVKVIGAADLPGLASISPFGRTAAPVGPAAVSKSTLKPGIGSALASQGGVPIVAQRQYGAGRVVFLAFDIHASPFKDWNGQTEFWKSIIRGSTSEPMVETSTGFVSDQGRGGYYQPDYYNNGLVSAVMQNPSIKTPSINTIGFFLLAYLVVLVPVNYFVLRKKRRLELAWVSTPVVVLLFAFGAYAIGYTMKGGELRLSECRFIEGSSGARYARAVSNAFVFSPARRSYDLAVADPTAMSQVIPLSRDDGPVDTYLGETTGLADVAIPMWSSKTFEAVGGEDLGGCIASALRLSGGEVSGTIRNDTNVDLRDCVVYLGKDKSDAFTLHSGESRQVSVKIGSGIPVPEPNYYNTDTDVRLRLLKFGDYKASTTGLALVGFSSQPSATFRMPNYAHTERAACYLFHLDYDAGNLMTIVPAMASATWDNSPPGGNSAPGGFLMRSMYPGEKVGATFRLPLPNGYRTTSLRIVGSAPKDIACTIFNVASRTWEGIDPASNKPLANPADYVNSENRVRVRAVNNGNSAVAISKLGISAEAKRQ